MPEGSRASFGRGAAVTAAVMMMASATPRVHTTAAAVAMFLFGVGVLNWHRIGGTS